MTMSKTHNRGPLNHGSGSGGGWAQPGTDLATGTWRSARSIPIFYALFALLSILTMMLGKNIRVMWDELNPFSLVTCIQLYSGALALIGCGENVLHAIVTHDIMEWILVIGLVLEQLPTRLKNHESVVVEEQKGQHSRVQQGGFGDGRDENGFKDYKEHYVDHQLFHYFVDEKISPG